MHSEGQMTSGADAQASELSAPTTSWTRFAEEVRGLFLNGRDMRARKARLVEEHRDLDDLIMVLGDELGTDEALIARLKKRKLAIRDEIARAEMELASGLVRVPP